jgi:HAD superfamily hydrolase (TIGR01509 family)
VAAHVLPEGAGVLVDIGLTLVNPSGEKLSRALKQRLGVSLEPHRCVASFRRAIFARDQRAFALDDTQAFWESWCAAAEIPREAAPELSALIAELDRWPERLWTDLEPGALDLLGHLRARGHRLGVVSVADGYLREELRQVGLDSFFEVIVDSGEAGLEKPDPAAFLHALAALGLPPERCCFIGDDWRRDIEPTAALGFQRVYHYDPLGLYRGGLNGIHRLETLHALGHP